MHQGGAEHGAEGHAVVHQAPGGAGGQGQLRTDQARQNSPAGAGALAGQGRAEGEGAIVEAEAATELGQQADLDPLLTLLTLPVRSDAVLVASSQQILVRRPDLFPAVQTILLERLPLLTREDLMEIATIPAKDLRHTRVAQEWIEEGRLEGAAQGEAKVMLRQLNRRCGPLADGTTARIQALPLKQLETLADALLDFRGPADLAAWLEEHKG